jgi:hypothetical protein
MARAKKENPRDGLFETIGLALAAAKETDVFHVKMKGTPECLVITLDDVDFTVSITQKKAPLEFDEAGGDVKAVYETEGTVRVPEVADAE